MRSLALWLSAKLPLGWAWWHMHIWAEHVSGAVGAKWRASFREDLAIFDTALASRDSLQALLQRLYGLELCTAEQVLELRLFAFVGSAG